MSSASPVVGLLQWGRENELAEIQAAELAQARADVLQWGRENELAEIGQGDQAAGLPVRMLQWGRENELAEMGSLTLPK